MSLKLRFWIFCVAEVCRLPRNQILAIEMRVYRPRSTAQRIGTKQYEWLLAYYLMRRRDGKEKGRERKGDESNFPGKLGDLDNCCAGCTSHIPESPASALHFRAGLLMKSMSAEC